jgi:dGTPase
MREEGGFDHNRQSLRVVDLLEQRTPDHPGLNLTEETREGILKHGCHWSHPAPVPKLGRQRPLESQAADVADEIAYMNHDLDDALRSGLIELEQIADWPLIGDALRRGDAGLAPGLQRARAVSVTINTLVSDVIEHSAATLEAEAPESPDCVRAAARAWVGFSPPVYDARRALKRLLSEHFYHHPRVAGMTQLAEKVVADLFELYRSEPARLPEHVRARFDADEGPARAIADHVAGMTDRFAAEQHRLAFGPGAEGLGEAEHEFG